MGATWIGGGVAGTLELLSRSLRPGGMILVGEPFWRQMPPTEEVARGCHATSIADFLMLPGLIASFGDPGYDVVEMVLAGQDGWDRYEAAKWLTMCRWLIGPSNDLPGSLNRHRFQLEMGSHPDKEIQHDWTELGPNAFVIEVLDHLEVPEGQHAATAEDLDALHQLWLEKLDASGQALYPMSRRGLSNRTPRARG